VIFRPDAQLSKHHSSGRRELSVRTFLYVKKLRTIPSCICPDVSATRPDVVQCSTSYGISSKTQIWEDSCNFPNDVCSRPNALLHKASHAFKVQQSGCHSSWFGHSNFIYENCMHQFNLPDDNLHGPKAPSLDMEIACS
jgi:hypothetical protein